MEEILTPRNIRIKEALLCERGRIFLYIIFLCLVFIIFTSVTTVLYYLSKHNIFPHIPFLGQFSLAHERNVAAWGSGAILFISGLILLNNIRSLNNTDRKANLGYIGLGLILFGLSADEVGSIHERIDDIIPLNNAINNTLQNFRDENRFLTDDFVWEIPRLFFFLLLIFLFLFQTYLLCKDTVARKYILLVIAAFVLFSLVYAQEKLEYYINTEYILTPVQGAMRVILEELCELVGFFLLLLFAVITKTLRVDCLSQLGRHARVSELFPFFIKYKVLCWVLVFGVGIISITVSEVLLSDVIWTSSDNSIDYRGVMAEWYFSILYLLSSLIIAAMYYCARSNIRAVAAFLLILLVSVLTIILSYQNFPHIKIYVIIPIIYIAFIIYFYPWRRYAVQHFAISLIVTLIFIIVFYFSPGRLIMFFLEGFLAVAVLGCVFARMLEPANLSCQGDLKAGLRP
jgi:hypothetical protein